MFKGHMPDITPAQIIAGLTWLGAQAVGAGWVDNAHEQRYLFLGSTIVSSVWIAGDALLRGFRNIRKAAEAKAGV